MADFELDRSMLPEDIRLKLAELDLELSEAITKERVARSRVEGGWNDQARLSPADVTLSSQPDGASEELPPRSYEDVYIPFPTEPPKLYSCSFCQKSFIRRADCKRHEVVHTKERFNCSYCAKSFTQKHQKRSHEKYYHEHGGGDNL